MFTITNDARFWDRIARKYAADPIADEAGYERTVERTRELLGADHAVLEIGCGTGTTALRLAPSVGRIVASDISGEMIAIARHKASEGAITNATFEVATPDNANWPDEAFDAVLGFNVLHLVAAREAALRSVHRLLKPGGLFITKTPCLRDMNPLLRVVIPLMQLVGKAPYVSVFSGDELVQEMEATGFAVIERALHGSRGKDARPFLVAKKR